MLGALVKSRLVPWVVSHPREAAMAYLAPSAKPPSLSAGETPRVVQAQPPHQADVVLLGQAVATFDVRLAELAASRQVPLESVTPDPALLLAAMASEDLSSSASIQLFAAYEKAFASVAAAPAPGTTP